MLYLHSTVGYLFAHLNQERPTFEVGLSSLSDILSNYAFFENNSLHRKGNYWCYAE